MEQSLITRYAIMNLTHCCFIDANGEDVPSFEMAVKFEEREKAFDFLKSKSESLKNDCVVYKVEIQTTFNFEKFGKDIGINPPILHKEIQDSEPPRLTTKTICETPFNK